MTKTIEVKGKSKTGKGIVDADKNWYNTGKGVSFETINRGDLVALDTDESGKFVLSFKVVGSSPAPVATPTVATKNTVSYEDAQAKREDGQREGNRRNVAAALASALIQTHGLKEADGLAVYFRVHDALVEKDK